jgi:hypothetical protein
VTLERTLASTKTELASLREDFSRLKAAKKLKKEQIVKQNKVRCMA